MEETETKRYGLRGAVFHKQEVYRENNRNEDSKEEEILLRVVEGQERNNRKVRTMEEMR